MPSKSKDRLDKLLIKQGIAKDIRQAQGMILSGEIYCETKQLDKPGLILKEISKIERKHKKNHPWVSRGGLKLAHALDYFSIKPANLTALDIGASTGGFTDVLLNNNVKKVYAIDVGYGELAWKLQNDERVIVLDRMNARHLTTDIIAEKIDIIVCDASFISLKSVLPKALSFASNAAILIALIKPQFEVAKHEVGNGGIITDKALHKRVCEDIKEWLGSLLGWSVIGITKSPITGMQGNVEFLIAAKFNFVN